MSKRTARPRWPGPNRPGANGQDHQAADAWSRNELISRSYHRLLHSPARRSDIDIQARTVRVARQLNERDGGGFAFGPPKSDAGQRIVAIPELITPDLAAHIMTHARPGDDGLVFTSPGGGPLRYTNIRRRFWVRALAAAGLPAMHFHDLRHTGDLLAADAGANLRELMERMGHSTTRAATVYLHGGTERQQVIADELSRQRNSWAGPRRSDRARNGHGGAGRHHDGVPGLRRDTA